jgi:hypothetical protein
MTKTRGRPVTPLRRVVRLVPRPLRRIVRAMLPAPDPFAGVRDPAGPVLVETASVAADSSRDAVRSLVILLPHLDLRRMTGGPNTALNLGVRLAARGTPVRFVATNGPVDDDVAALRSHVIGLASLTETGMDMTFESVASPIAPLQLGRHEVLMATWWATAYLAHAALAATACREILYLVQDFEPAFYPWSSNYALALATYDFPIRAIFNESFLRDHFTTNGVGRFASGRMDDLSIAFEPAVDRSLFRPRPRTGPQRLLFYARPRNPRNAFELGLRALRDAVGRGAFQGPWEFRSIGDQVPELKLGGGRTLEPVPWQALPDYAALLGSSDILLSLMLSPHTSYPPLEMAATGGIVVTNVFSVKTAAALAAISSRIVAVEPEVTALSAALAEAAAIPRQDIVATDLGLPSSWDATFEPIVDWIRSSMASIAGE